MIDHEEEKRREKKEKKAGDYWNGRPYLPYVYWVYYRCVCKVCES